MAEACSTAWSGSPAAGSAPRATWWLALEQPGPWGTRAPEQSRLDPHLGRALQSMASDAGGKLLLIRRPTRHPSGAGPRRVYLANSGARSPWLVQRDVVEPAELLGLDAGVWSAEGPEDAVASGWQVAEPVVLICAHSQRDICCALRGRPVAAALATELGERAWECSHLGGHRFAATGIVLPTGQSFARLTTGVTSDALAAADRGELFVAGPHDVRGLGTLDPVAQVADVLARERLGEARVGVLGFALAGTDPVEVDVEYPTGRLRVRVEKRTTHGIPVSCGKELGTYHEYVGKIVDPAAPNEGETQ